MCRGGKTPRGKQNFLGHQASVARRLLEGESSFLGSKHHSGPTCGQRSRTTVREVFSFLYFDVSIKNRRENKDRSPNKDPSAG